MMNNIGGTILAVLVGSVIGVILCTPVLLLILKCNRMRRVRGGNSGRPGGSRLSIYSTLIKKGDLAFLEQEEDVTATLEMIGSDGCGEVYKAGLSNGTFIAIKKVFRRGGEDGELNEVDIRLLVKKMRQVKAEIQTVSRINHRNLLPLLAHMARPNCHYLVYKYMQKGSLDNILRQVRQGERELDWVARYRIAVGVASGLEYIHMDVTPRILHRDLKPANVLLDDDMEARITDFGISRMLSEEHTHFTPSRAIGTVGYIAPEYNVTKKFTDKCDIYSFGVLLGVLVIGKSHSDAFFGSLGLAK